nr:auxilin-like protein [Tanacetum cinerariifolium]
MYLAVAWVALLTEMSADVARSHGGDGGGEDLPLHTMYPAVAWVTLLTEAKHLQKAYNTNKAAFKAQHWVIDPTTGTYNVEKIRRERPENITASEWDKYTEFWNDPRNIARAAQNKQNQAKSTVISRQGSRGRPQPLRSKRRLLTHSSWHTLLTGNSFGMRIDLYTESGGCGDEKEGANHQDDEDEDGDSDTVSPLMGLSSQSFTVRQTALKDASCKVTKHEKACIENQHVFVPFAFDTFGFLAPEAVELLNRLELQLLTMRTSDFNSAMSRFLERAEKFG